MSERSKTAGSARAVSDGLLRTVGPTILAVAAVALGIMNILRHDFTPIFHPMPDGLPLRAAVASFSSPRSLRRGWPS